MQFSESKKLAKEANVSGALKYIGTGASNLISKLTNKGGVNKAVDALKSNGPSIKGLLSSKPMGGIKGLLDSKPAGGIKNFLSDAKRGVGNSFEKAPVASSLAVAGTSGALTQDRRADKAESERDALMALLTNK